MTRLQDPLDTQISSSHPVAGTIIRAYKRLVKRLIDPYLRHVFDREHENLSLINLRLERTDKRLDALEQQMREAQAEIDSLHRLWEAQWGELSVELIDRMDTLTLVLNHRYDEIQNRITSGGVVSNDPPE